MSADGHGGAADAEARAPLRSEDAARPTHAAAVPAGVVCDACLHAARAEAEAIDAAVARPDGHLAASLCPRHLWLAVDRGLSAGPLVAALDACLALLDQSRASGGAHRAGPRCPACAAMDRGALALLESSADAATVCVPHAALALEHGVDVQLDGFVHAGRALEAEMAELIRKADYRFRDEPRGAERDSWLRGLARVSGAPRVHRVKRRGRRGGPP